MSNKLENRDFWFTVVVRFDREYGAREISKPHIKEVEVTGAAGELVLYNKEGEVERRDPMEEVEWYKVKPQQREWQEEE